VPNARARSTATARVLDGPKYGFHRYLFRGSMLTMNVGSGVVWLPLYVILGCSKLGGQGSTSDASTPASGTALAATPSPPPPPAPKSRPITVDDVPKYDAASPDAYCRNEWTKRGELDQNMFDFCVAQEKKGYDDLIDAVKKYGKNEWAASLFNAIWSEWTKRGVTQYRMVAYNMSREGDAFLDYQYEAKQPKYDAAKMAACAAEWQHHASRWTQTMYCYKNG
jgi:hypothetical protein